MRRTWLICASGVLLLSCSSPVADEGATPAAPSNRAEVVLDELEQSLKNCESGSTPSCVEAAGRTTGEVDRLMSYTDDPNPELWNALRQVQESLTLWLSDCRDDPTVRTCAVTVPGSITLEPIRLLAD